MIKKIVLFINNLFSFCGYILWLFIKYPYRTRITKRSGDLFILANGPSLKNDISQIKEKIRDKNPSVMVINYFAFDEAFFEIKPEHYCLIDPMFFKKTTRESDARKLFGILESRVNWKMTIYIPMYFSKTFLSFSQIENENIEIEVINNCKYMGFEKYRNYFYKYGFSCPELYTVAALAIYVGILTEYENIKLYGFDHTFFDNLRVNDKNELSSIYKHFYQSEEDVKLEPIRKIESGEVWKVSEYIIEKGFLFRSHDHLQSFADFVGVNIINCTQNTLIDSYKRKINF